MTEIDRWKKLLADLGTVTGPNREIDNQLAALVGKPWYAYSKRPGTIIGLIKRTLPDHDWCLSETGDSGIFALVGKHPTYGPRANKVWRERHAGGPALALLMAYARAMIASLEQRKAA